MVFVWFFSATSTGSRLRKSVPIYEGGKGGGGGGGGGGGEGKGEEEGSYLAHSNSV